MVTAGMSDAVMLRPLENGSSGVFLKHSPPSRLVEAIRKGGCRRGLARPRGDPFHHRRGHRQCRRPPPGTRFDAA